MAGVTDAVAAERWGISETTVRRWRNERAEGAAITGEVLTQRQACREIWGGGAGLDTEHRALTDDDIEAAHRMLDRARQLVEAASAILARAGRP